MSKWQWAWIKSGRIFVPGGFQKNGRPLVLPITPGSERLLNELREISSHAPWLFPNPFETAPRKSFGKNKVRLQDKMKLNEHWTMRDLRRTTETLLRELRIRPEVVAVILNHNTSQLRKIYDKSESLPEKRKALLRYEKYLERLRTKGVPEKVVELEGYRGHSNICSGAHPMYAGRSNQGRSVGTQWPKWPLLDLTLQENQNKILFVQGDFHCFPFL